MKIIETLTNAEYGIAAVVAKVAKGFSVALHDTDAEEFLPENRIFGTLAAAKIYAAGLVA